jgi:hypothetical protein
MMHEKNVFSRKEGISSESGVSEGEDSFNQSPFSRRSI